MRFIASFAKKDAVGVAKAPDFFISPTSGR
ncbi:hypothetical protein HNP92_001990 [Methanococcus maripaludis]|uniref:Uncharacterized protein n=1 Tax=Methanococcus maripaludis TaxID=39152 RepID=A0A7J9S9F1_METMI|nr:hypothetical protein [Methanococcus maripaludis]